MPTNRRRLSRSLRSAEISQPVLDLFVALEQMPRGSQAFREGKRELARMLGLEAEWLSGASVTDDEDAPCWPPEYVAYRAWHRTRALRLELLSRARSR